MWTEFRPGVACLPALFRARPVGENLLIYRPIGRPKVSAARVCAYSGTSERDKVSTRTNNKNEGRGRRIKEKKLG